MIFAWLLFITFGILVIVFPNLVAYLIGGFFVLIGLNIIIGAFLVKKKAKEDGVRIAGYKIYKG